MGAAKGRQTSLTIRRTRQQGRERRELILRELLRVLMPGILMRLAEVARTTAHRRRHWYRVVRVLRKHRREQ